MDESILSHLSVAKIEGAGIGLRSCHFSEVLDSNPEVAWFEVLIDNFMNEGGPALEKLEVIARHYPLTFHSVGLSLGSTDEFNLDYVEKLKALIDRFNPQWLSDHLCWTSVSGLHSNDLLPLPYNKEALDHVVSKIKQIQDRLGRAILIENVSSYVSFKHSQMQEWEFLSEVCERADCDILLDINNIYVSSFNHKFDAKEYFKVIDPNRVKEYHLAGYTDHDTYLLDSHSESVHAPVWDLYDAALQYFGPRPTLIEWDAEIPELQVLINEAKKADSMMEMVCS